MRVKATTPPALSGTRFLPLNMLYAFCSAKVYFGIIGAIEAAGWRDGCEGVALDRCGRVVAVIGRSTFWPIERFDAGVGLDGVNDHIDATRGVYFRSIGVHFFHPPLIPLENPDMTEILFVMRSAK